MGFSQEWDEQYSANAHLSVWPWSDLVSYVMRYAKPMLNSEWSDMKVLEIGCGAGANIPFFKRLGCHYDGIDGSPSIINTLKMQYPELSENLLVQDFTKSLPNENYDLIVDRASLTHNSTIAIQSAIILIHNRLKPNGKFIGIDWFSTQYSDYLNLGERTTDEYTKTFDDKSRSFSSLGNVHFSDELHIMELFSQFKITNLQHKTIEDAEMDWKFASWNFVATKI